LRRPFKDHINASGSCANTSGSFANASESCSIASTSLAEGSRYFVDASEDLDEAFEFDMLHTTSILTLLYLASSTDRCLS